MQGQWRRVLALLLRDVVVVGVAVLLWESVPRHPESVSLATITALLTTVVGYLAHEWGHLLGALYQRCAFELPRTPFESPFLFRFDREANSRPQFFGMALGGFAASLLTIVILPLVLPWQFLATKITLALVGLGVLATLVIEVPEFVRVWRGAPIPSGAAFVGQKGR